MSDLNDFKVEELEQRLEMGSWSGSVEGGCTGSDCDFDVEATYTITF
tara:strand:- start:3901 stop:4041 length:141 start_codon:yes stop_codon:yes gene_type:complete